MKSTVTVVTLNADRYLQQLCKHWGHRFTVRLDDTTGDIDFGGGEAVSLKVSADILTVVVTVENAGGLDDLERVVAEHIARFGFREDLLFDWQRQV